MRAGPRERAVGRSLQPERWFPGEISEEKGDEITKFVAHGRVGGLSPIRRRNAESFSKLALRLRDDLAHVDIDLPIRTAAHIADLEGMRFVTIEDRIFRRRQRAGGEFCNNTNAI